MVVTQSDIRRALSLWNDVKAARRGPRAILRRQARKALWRGAASIIARLVPARRN